MRSAARILKITDYIPVEVSYSSDRTSCTTIDEIMVMVHLRVWIQEETSMKLSRLIIATAASALIGTSAASDTNLVFWSMWNEQEPQAQALREVMDAYSAANPEVTFETVWNGRQNQVKIRAALQAGTQIDFMDQDGDQLVAGLVSAGLGMPLNDMLSGGLADALLPEVLELYKRDGEYVLLPYIYNPVSFWYSKEMFADLGIEVPATIDALIEACQTASAADVNLLVTEGNVGSYQLFHFTYLLQRISGPGAVRALIEDRTGASWRSDAVRQALEIERAMWDNECFSDDVRGFQYPAGQQTIAIDEAAAELVGAWLPAELSKAVGDDFKWGSFSFPAVDGGTGSANDLQASLLTMMVFNNSPNKEVAADFLGFLMSQQGQEIIATTGKVGVTRNDVVWGEAISDGYAIAIAAEQIMPINDAVPVFFPEYLVAVLTPTHSAFFLGQLSADEFVDAMVEKSANFWAN